MLMEMTQQYYQWNFICVHAKKFYNIRFRKYNFFNSTDYDDGFVAYINGTEIARANINGSPAFDQGTIIDHEAQIYNGGIPDRFPISDFNSIC